MGVYITSMKMPPNCCQCPVNMEVCKRGYEYLLKHSELYDKRADDCPIVEIPPHGRLIDADALADVFRGFIAMYDSCPFSQLSFTDKTRRDELQTALAEVINAPTIITAEEGET